MPEYIVTAITTSPTHAVLHPCVRLLSHSFKFSSRHQLQDPHASCSAIVFEVTCNHELSANEYRELNDAAEQLGVDVFIRPAETLQQEPKLFVFDMDSTIIQAEVIDRLAAHAGAG